jgi:hypothetical protein
VHRAARGAVRAKPDGHAPRAARCAQNLMGTRRARRGARQIPRGSFLTRPHSFQDVSLAVE